MNEIVVGELISSKKTTHKTLPVYNMSFFLNPDVCVVS